MQDTPIMTGLAHAQLVLQGRTRMWLVLVGAAAVLLGSTQMVCLPILLVEIVPLASTQPENPTKMRQTVSCARRANIQMLQEPACARLVELAPLLQFWVQLQNLRVSVMLVGPVMVQSHAALVNLANTRLQQVQQPVANACRVQHPSPGVSGYKTAYAIA